MPSSFRDRPVSVVLTLVCAGVVVSAYGVPARAQNDASKPAAGIGERSDKQKNVDLLRDFIHYTKIARYDLAKSYGQALLDKKLSAEDLVAMIEDSGDAQRFEETAVKAQRYAELEAVSSALLRGFEQGKLDRARAATEISKNISLLTGTQRNRLFARERLAFAGEYAVPQLLRAFVSRGNPALQAEVRQLLVDMGRQAVAPLCAALPRLDPAAQEQVAGILGEIPYKSSLPFLYDTRAAATSDGVKTACDKAITRLDPTKELPVSASEQYLLLARSYYAETPSLTSFPGEGNQLLWSFDAANGLAATAIATPLFNEAAAMRLSERALTLDPKNRGGLALWLAANFRREIETPQGYENPAYGKDRREAMYYAVAAGANASQRVLAMALDDRNTPLARKALAAIARSAGVASLWTGLEDRRPLIQSLVYPNRRVQYEAALALGAAKPSTQFDGADRVVPTLAAAVRDAGARYAVVVASDGERQQSIAEMLKAKERGFTVLPPARRLSDIEQALAEAPGIDLIVSDLPEQSTSELIQDVRGRAKLAAVPLLAMVSQAGFADLASRHDRDELTRISRAGMDPKQVAEAITQLVDRASGGLIGPDEARDYQVRALTVLRDLAVSGNTVLRVEDASLPLISALGAARPPVKFQIADVLANVPTKQAQIAVIDATLASSGDERVLMLARSADSARRFGNLLEPRQIERLLDLLKRATGAEATAIAALVGALDLPNDSLIPLIVGTK
ncbi:MAG: hypothetical protein JNM07_06310 [Phycisphaerae bacterium]|nr:hypothetical protein [Phycisphaerae bacterium]